MGHEAPDRKVIERDWLSRGFSCQLWVDPPGQRWEDFVHDTDELLVILEGKLELEMGGEVQRPAPGEEVFIPQRRRDHRPLALRIQLSHGTRTSRSSPVHYTRPGYTWNTPTRMRSSGSWRQATPRS